LCLRLREDVDDVGIANRIAEQGLTVRPLSAYCLQRTDLRGLVIGYGYAPLEDIRHYVPTLASAITREMALATSDANRIGGSRPPTHLIDISGAPALRPDVPHAPASGPAAAGTPWQEPGSAS
jgi:hypothetical protein